jgi:hypothetical protein
VLAAMFIDIALEELCALGLSGAIPEQKYKELVQTAINDLNLLEYFDTPSLFNEGASDE